MLQSRSKEEQRKGDCSILKLIQINMSDREPTLFTENYQNPSPKDAPHAHQSGTDINYSHHQDYYQIDGFFLSQSNTKPRNEEDVRPIEPEHPTEDKDQRSLTASEVTEIAMINLESPVNNIECTQINKPIDQQSPPGQQQAKGQNRVNHNFKKNIIGYIAKKAIKIVLKKYRFQLMKTCKEAGIQFWDLYNFYQDQEKKLSGPKNLAVMLRISKKDEKEKRMKEIFHIYFMRVLRRDYLIEAWKSGKMVDIEAYLCRKNKHLLYFAESISG